MMNLNPIKTTQEFQRTEDKMTKVQRSYGCCLYCGHCTDEVIAEMMECKCNCHA